MTFLLAISDFEPVAGTKFREVKRQLGNGLFESAFRILMLTFEIHMTTKELTYFLKTQEKRS